MEDSSGGGNISSNGVVMKNQGLGFSSGGMKIENPFSFKALQVFTGFGVGCGIGIGSGAPLNLGAVPMVGEVMSAARGATNAFSGVTHRVNDALWKLGARNIKAGVGCGVGFGHGFGVGIAVKPSAIRKLKASILGTASNLMTKLGRTNDEASNETEMEDLSSQSLSVDKKHEDTKTPIEKSVSSLGSETFGTRTENVINSFLQNPILKQEDTAADERKVTQQLESENFMLQMVLRQQKLIDELMDENKKLRSIIAEGLKASPEKLKSIPSCEYQTTCSDCFECRRKQRRKR